MRKKYTPELRERAVRMVLERQAAQGKASLALAPSRGPAGRSRRGGTANVVHPPWSRGGTGAGWCGSGRGDSPPQA